MPLTLNHVLNPRQIAAVLSVGAARQIGVAPQAEHPHATVFTSEATPTLWMDLGGRVACARSRCGGAALRAAIEAAPLALEHTTTLSAWLTADGQGFPCETCGEPDPGPRVPGAGNHSGSLTYDPTSASVVLRRAHAEHADEESLPVWSQANGVDPHVLGVTCLLLEISARQLGLL